MRTSPASVVGDRVAIVVESFVLSVVMLSVVRRDKALMQGVWSPTTLGLAGNVMPYLKSGDATLRFGC